MADLIEGLVRAEAADNRRMARYLNQLEEQMRLFLANLDGENIQAGTIGERQLSGDVVSQLGKVEDIANRTARNEKTVKQMERQAAAKMEGSLPIRLYCGFTQPEGHGIVWIIPAQPLDGVSGCAVKYIE